MNHPGGNDGQARLFETAINLANEITAHAVRLDYGKGALDRHRLDPLSKNYGEKFAGDQTANGAAQASRAVYLGTSVRGNLGDVAGTPRKYRFRKEFWRGRLGRGA